MYGPFRQGRYDSAYARLFPRHYDEQADRGLQKSFVSLLNLIIRKNVLGLPGVPAGWSTRYEQQIYNSKKAKLKVVMTGKAGCIVDSHPFTFISSRSFSVYSRLASAQYQQCFASALLRIYVRHWPVNV